MRSAGAPGEGSRKEAEREFDAGLALIGGDDAGGDRNEFWEDRWLFTLIDLLRKPFNPEEYHDHYREALAQLIEAKLEGRDVVKAPAARETKVIDLADALRKSVEAARKGGKAKPAAKAAVRRQTRPARRTRKVS